MTPDELFRELLAACTRSERERFALLAGELKRQAPPEPQPIYQKQIPRPSLPYDSAPNPGELKLNADGAPMLWGLRHRAR
jgi:hypothetical protein